MKYSPEKIKVVETALLKSKLYNTSLEEQAIDLLDKLNIIPSLGSMYSEFKDLAPWEKYYSDLVLRVDHVLTEPTCPSVSVEFELPERAGYRYVSNISCDDIQNGIIEALEKAKIKLSNK